MTGPEFESIFKQYGYSKTSLAERWGMSRQAITNFCKSDKVSPVYADAIKVIAYEHQVAQISGIIKLIEH